MDNGSSMESWVYQYNILPNVCSSKYSTLECLPELDFILVVIRDLVVGKLYQSATWDLVSQKT